MPAICLDERMGDDMDDIAPEEDFECQDPREQVTSPNFDLLPKMKARDMQSKPKPARIDNEAETELDPRNDHREARAKNY